MNLREYLKSISSEQAETLAKTCGTTLGYLRQVAYGNRRVRESLAIKLEKETGRAVQCEDLRPDVDWSVIRNTQAA